MNNTPVDMLNTTYRLNWPGVKMTSYIFYFGDLQAPQEVRDRRLVLHGNMSSGRFRDVISPENTLSYVAVNGTETEEGLSYDNHNQAMVIDELCSEFLAHGINPSRISVIAAYRPHVITLNSVLNRSGITCTTIHKMLGGENDIVILATTRSNSSRDLGFMRQPELLNVATSRQLMKLIIVGDAGETFAEGCTTSRRIHDFIESRGFDSNNKLISGHDIFINLSNIIAKARHGTYSREYRTNAETAFKAQFDPGTSHPKCIEFQNSV
jgi:superfamily I DNA and/or RNA helicase